VVLVIAGSFCDLDVSGVPLLAHAFAYVVGGHKLRPQVRFPGSSQDGVAQHHCCRAPNSLVAGLLAVPLRSAGRRTALAAAAAPVQFKSEGAALEILGFRRSESPGKEEMKQAFKRAVLKAHPDRPGGSADAFMRVLDAHALLTGNKPTGNTFESAQTTKREPVDFSEEGNWRWDQNKGYNPDDLQSVWEQMGYNPYTGEHIEQNVRDPVDSASDGAAYSYPSPGSYASEPRGSASPSAAGRSNSRPRGNPPEADEPELDMSMFLPMCGYVGFITLCIMKLSRDLSG